MQVLDRWGVIWNDAIVLRANEYTKVAKLMSGPRQESVADGRSAL